MATTHRGTPSSSTKSGAAKATSGKSGNGKPAGGQGGKPNGQAAAGKLHQQREDNPWTINIPDHAARTDSPQYVKSRTLMNQTAAKVKNFYYGTPPYQDHHGGGLWLKDADGWFMVKNVAGMEWSSQFCADPARVDLLRQNAKRLYALCPDAAKELGIQELLDTPITDAAGVARWTDSICNASVPLAAADHTGIIPQGGGYHHYPAPIVEIQFFKFNDFELWVTDNEGNPAAVVPASPRGSGKGDVRVVYSTPNTPLRKQHFQAQRAQEPLILPADHPLAKQAFVNQTVHTGT